MKKKIFIGIAVFLLGILCLYDLLSTTDLTKGIAEHTARAYFDENYSDFGEIVDYSCSTGIEEHYTFPKRTIRSYSIVFVNEARACVKMEVSSYWPFVVYESEKFQLGYF